MTWREAMAEAQEHARRNPGCRYVVFAYRAYWTPGAPWRYAAAFTVLEAKR